MNKKKKIVISILGIITIMLITVGITYAVFSYTRLGTTENIVTAGTLRFLYTENATGGRGISITNALPVTDETGKSYTEDNQVFDFKVEGENTSRDEIPYEITLRQSSDSTLPNSVVKVYLTDTTSGNETELIQPTFYSALKQTNLVTEENIIEKTIYQDIVEPKVNNYLKSFRLRMWIDNRTNFSATGEDENGELIYPYNGKKFTLTVNVYSNKDIVVEKDLSYKEALLNGADPVLEGSLIPVQISDNGTVTKADINSKWYSYENKEWANAIILKDESITYQNGETIPEANIESYFVWIPRYKYKIFDDGNYTGLTQIESKEQTIEVAFENNTVTPSNGQTKGNYLTHPAFTSFDSNGFWVGKFETGYDGATSTTAAQVNSVATDKIIIKPNTYSWRNITVGNMFKNGYEYQRSLDSHMMKNTEWGAVAYLQHSAYGSATSVRINNNSAAITGYSATEEPTLGYNGGTSIGGNRVESTDLGVDGTYTINYLNSSGTVSSTTGNYTGIYDMSGGAWEYVMGYTTGASTVGGSSGITDLYANFFSDTTYTKYWDKYISTSVTNYNNRILGDATGEMGTFGSKVDPDGGTRYKSSWYGDYSTFTNVSASWFSRGSSWNDGTATGVFAFGNYTGNTYRYIGYRIVLTPGGNS